MLYIASDKYLISGVAESKQGGRVENQDGMGFVDTPIGFLLVVCDGMGGGPGGKTASALAMQVFMQSLITSNEQMSRQEAMKIAIGKANEALYDKMNDIPELQGMGTTLVAILINEQSAIIAHVGDSRCYHLRGHKMLFKTTDHSLVAELIHTKALTEEQARVSPQSNVIKRALGNTNNHIPEIEELPFLKGDRFILCSDGVWGIMPHKDLLERFTANLGLDAIVSNLCNEIDQIGFSHGGGHDNHTLMMIEMGIDSKKKGEMNRKTIITIGLLASLLLLSLAINCLVMSDIVGGKNGSKRMVKELENKVTEYENILFGSDEEKAIEYRRIENERIVLQTIIDKQKVVIDSLMDMIKQKEGSEEYEDSNPEEIINHLLILCDDFANNYAFSLNEAAKRKEHSKTEINNLLNKFNEVTNSKYKSSVEHIKKELKKDVLLKVDKPKNNKYYSTGKAKEAIKVIKKEIENLKSELKQS